MHHNSLGLQCINRSNTDWGYSSIQYNYLVAAFSHPWSQRVTQPHGNTTIASSHPFSSRTPWRHHFQVEPKIMFKFKDFMRTPHPGAVFFSGCFKHFEVQNTMGHRKQTYFRKDAFCEQIPCSRGPQSCVRIQAFHANTSMGKGVLSSPPTAVQLGLNISPVYTY